jgi:hypothetical protein
MESFFLIIGHLSPALRFFRSPPVLILTVQVQSLIGRAMLPRFKQCYSTVQSAADLFYKPLYYWQNDNELYSSIQRALYSSFWNLNACNFFCLLIFLTIWSNEHVYICMLVNISRHPYLDFTLLKVAVPLIIKAQLSLNTYVRYIPSAETWSSEQSNKFPGPCYWM